ncbi:hypothetical protein STAS_31109 [Striga asiatica]|uniref:Protein BIG GRAIN 1-like A n=1 Tax=Striga asiatica TaxID=4170 RepID=A0A5A7RAF6_STRAF|nr:hypothetical protein STAS_31109 [Striga asiatica]
MAIGISQCNYNLPSFSSSLLDAIYRSIDQGDDEMVIYRESAAEKQNQGGAGVFTSEEEMANFRRACMLEKWMEKKSGEKTAARRRSAADLQMKKPRKSDRTTEMSSWSSSDSEPFPLPRPKPVRTGASAVEKEKFRQNLRDPESNPRGRLGDESDPSSKLAGSGVGGGGFLKTKSRALKIYGDLKKAKQPISPGGKLAGFLNSLFAGTGKPKSAGRGDHHSPSPKSTNTSTCSSASSLSRSCLSKTPSSRGKLFNSGVKRSVRFSPVGATAGNDSHKSAHDSKAHSKFEAVTTQSMRNAINEELMAHIMEKNRHVESVARDLLATYQRKIQLVDDSRKSRLDNRLFDRVFEEDDDDVASCASSDLFELDNLSAIGMERYSEELPVYETTHLDRTSRVSANGMIF